MVHSMMWRSIEEKFHKPAHVPDWLCVNPKLPCQVDAKIKNSRSYGVKKIVLTYNEYKTWKGAHQRMLHLDREL